MQRRPAHSWPGREDGEFLRRTASQAVALGITAERLGPADLSARFPAIRFPDGTGAVYEPAGGHLSPRRLVAAQTAAAAAAGVRVIRAEARRLLPGGVVTEAETVRADEVLVAAGGFSNALLPEPLAITVHARTVAFFRLSSGTAASLSGLPALIEDIGAGHRPYLLPPIRYPDGHLYLKLGGERVDLTLPDAEAAKGWFRLGGNPAVADEMARHLADRLPGVSVAALSHGPCVVTTTRSDRPAIGRLGPGLSVATAGCGQAAKGSDELGRLAACAALGIDAPDLALTRPTLVRRA